MAATMSQWVDLERLARMRVDDSDAHYVDGNGVSHDSALAVLGEELGWCGCGDPDGAAKLLLTALEIIDDSASKYAATEAKWKELGYGNDLVRVIFLYWLCDQGFTDHGTSVFGGWLTDAGHQLMTDLRYAIAESAPL